MRKFFAVDREGKLQAFAFFDPIHEGGKVKGFFCSAERRRPIHAVPTLVAITDRHAALLAAVRKRQYVKTICTASESIFGHS